MHFSQRRLAHYSSKLFIALWQQANDSMTSQPIPLQLSGILGMVFLEPEL